MTFRYRVRDTLGNSHAGRVEASSADEATLQLRRGGFQVLEVEEDLDDLGPGLFSRRARKPDVLYATNQLAVMVDTGITLSAALDNIIQQEQNPSLKAVLADLKSAVEEGSDFSAALARHPKLFDKTYISLVKASEATGTMGKMLERIAGYLRKELETRGKVRAAMAYPAVMMVLAVGVTIFLLTFVLPKFTPLFERKGVELPKPTRLMMNLSALLLDYWYAWAAAAVVLPLAVVLARRTESGRQAWDWLKINLPILGPMFRKVVISRSIRTLGTLLSSGIPMLDALELSADVAGNYHYERLWRSVGQTVTEGRQVCQALAGSPLFPPMLVQMISAGEQTGKLGPVLERVSNYYDQEVETSLKTVTSLIEPLMIAVMGVVVGGVALALLLPIFTLSRTPG
ncbi:MAG: type II secretion system F family protein [Pirellulales bacterium]